MALSPTSWRSLRSSYSQARSGISGEPKPYNKRGHLRWAASVFSPTPSRTRSRPERSWNGRPAWSRSCSKTRWTPGRREFRIEVEAGGRRLIRLADDGSGMLRDDALLAFERHATSKLADVKDLLSIATLGFRGEALPSIASVSRLLLETRSPDERSGTAVEFAGGKLLRCDEAALAAGHHSSPFAICSSTFRRARSSCGRSRPKSPTSPRWSRTTAWRIPARRFVLRHNNAELLNVTPVATLRERVFQVFGSRILDDLVDLGDRSRDLNMPTEPDEPQFTRRFRLRGFVSGPQVQKLNRNSIYLFVNGRLIRDRLLLHAISSAYHNLMPPACYPFALLFLDCDAEEVDVNVHPSKTEVRFRHGSVVHDFVRDSVREILMAQRPASNIPAPTPPQPGAGLPYSEFSQRIESMNFPSVSAAAATAADAANSAGIHSSPASLARAAIRLRPGCLQPEAGRARYAWTAVPRRSAAGSRESRRADRPAPARPDPRQLHHRGGPRRVVDHRPARGP